MGRGILPTTYCFAGDRARSPWVKLDAYDAFLEMRFCWTGVAMTVEAIQGRDFAREASFRSYGLLKNDTRAMKQS